MFVKGVDGKQKEAPEDVRLVVADVDGALVTPDKVVTPRARAAVRKPLNRELLSPSPAAGLHEA